MLTAARIKTQRAWSKAGLNEEKTESVTLENYKWILPSSMFAVETVFNKETLLMLLLQRPAEEAAPG